MGNVSFKKLSKNGNSAAIIIERPLLDLLGATPESFVKRTIEGNKLILEFVSAEERKKILAAEIEATLDNQRDVYKRLAE